MAAALTKSPSEQLKHARAHIARTREATKRVAKEFTHTAVSSASSYTIGYLEAKGVQLPTVAKQDPKMVYGLGAAAATFMLPAGSKARQYAQSFADGMLAVVAYDAGREAGAAAKAAGK
jgi:hypothetical protein